MSIFDFVTVALSLILGLGVTRLLESGVSVFRLRQSVRLHWMPFAWAFAVLLQQLQFWWALYELQQMAHVTIAIFGLLVVLAMLLFVAGALILPSERAECPDELLSYLGADGSWGIAAVGTYHLVGVIGNFTLFGTDWSRPITWLGLSCGLLALVIAATRKRELQILLSLAWFALLVAAIIVATNPEYSLQGLRAQ